MLLVCFWVLSGARLLPPFPQTQPGALLQHRQREGRVMQIMKNQMSLSYVMELRGRNSSEYRLVMRSDRALALPLTRMRLT